MIDFLDILPQIKYIINRAKKIINSKLKYEPRREFTTKQTAQLNIINQYGDVASYSQNVLLTRVFQELEQTFYYIDKKKVNEKRSNK